jgi:hypothetical protein
MNKPRVIRINNKSGSSFTIDVTELRLSDNLSERDFYVLHNGENKTSLYTKTSQTTLTYNGPNVAAGTIIQTARQTIVQPADVTFLSVSTAQDLTLALTKLKKASEDIEAHLNFALNQIEAGGISLLPLSVINEAYGTSWNGDTISAPSRNSVYQRLNQLFTGSNQLTGTYDITSGSVLVPTQANTNNSTAAASTAFVSNKLNELLAANNTFSGSNTFTGANTVSGSLSVPTQANSSNSTAAASTAFVSNKINESLNDFRAANNTFTGSNTFSNSISVPTISNARNSSTNAASTAFVHSAIYSNIWVIASTDSNPTITTGSWQDLPLNTTLVNRNSIYNTSNFIWTCPETGFWRIMVNCYPTFVGGTPPSSVAVVYAVTFSDNTTVQEISYFPSQNQFVRNSCFLVMPLTAGTQYKTRLAVNVSGGSGWSCQLRANSSYTPYLTIERIA